MASSYKSNTWRNAGIAAVVILLLLGGYFLFFRSSGDGIGEVNDLRVKQIELYNKLLETDPGNIDILIKIGNLYKAMGEIDSSIEYYKRALAIDPKNYSALNEQATRMKGDYERPSLRSSSRKNIFRNIRSPITSSATYTMTARS